MAGSAITGALGLTKEETGFSETGERTTARDETQRVAGREAFTELDEETLGGLQDLVQQLMAGTFSGEAIEGSAGELAQFISERAQAGGAEQEAETGAIVGEARRKGEAQLSRLQQELARASGGSIANTLVASATGEAAVGLESQLAALQAQLGIEGRRTETEELSQAFSSILGSEQAGQQNLASLLGVLRGAAGERTFESETELASMLEELSSRAGAGIAHGRDISAGYGGANKPPTGST